MTFPMLDQRIEEAEGTFASEWNTAAGRGNGSSDGMLIAAAINVASLRIQRALLEIASTPQGR